MNIIRKRKTTRGVALFVVMGVALFAAIVFGALFSVLRQSAWLSRNFGQRLQAGMWNDRILARIESVILANDWERRFYMTRLQPPPEIYSFDEETFPFADLAQECELEQISFEGAIMDVPGAKKYRVKLNVNIGAAGITYSTFTECRYAPNMLDLANRGVSQTMINLDQGDVGLQLQDFARSLLRLQGIAKIAQTGSFIPQEAESVSRNITVDEVSQTVEFPNTNNITGLPEDLVQVAQHFKSSGSANFLKILTTINEINSVPSGVNPMSTIRLPNGQTPDEYVLNHPPTIYAYRYNVPFNLENHKREFMVQREDGSLETPTRKENLVKAIALTLQYCLYALFEDEPPNHPKNDTLLLYEFYLLEKLIAMDGDAAVMWPHLVSPAVCHGFDASGKWYQFYQPKSSEYVFYKQQIELWNRGSYSKLNGKMQNYLGDCVFVACDDPYVCQFFNGVGGLVPYVSRFFNGVPGQVPKFRQACGSLILWLSRDDISHGNIDNGGLRALMSQSGFPLSLNEICQFVDEGEFEDGLKAVWKLQETMLNDRDQYHVRYPAVNRPFPIR